jgi:hypothetical protein
VNFFVAKICHFAGKHSSKQYGQGNFLENFQENHHISSYGNHQDFLRIWADF